MHRNPSPKLSSLIVILSVVTATVNVFADDDSIARGQRLYSSNCAACHQPTGLGLPGQYPPLAGIDLVQSKGGYGDNHLTRVVLGGLTGPLILNGTTYNGNMPAQAANLSDDQIAAILTYIRQAWGNKADPITSDVIAAVRKETADHSNAWTDDELKKIPATVLSPK